MHAASLTHPPRLHRRMLSRSAARLLHGALARPTTSVARVVLTAVDSTGEVPAPAVGRVQQVLRPPPGVDGADFARALKSLSAQHQPLVELPGVETSAQSGAAGVLLPTRVA